MVTVKGRVLNPWRQPMPGITVVITTAAGSSTEVTDQAGEYSAQFPVNAFPSYGLVSIGWTGGSTERQSFYYPYKEGEPVSYADPDYDYPLEFQEPDSVHDQTSIYVPGAAATGELLFSVYDDTTGQPLPQSTPWTVTLSIDSNSMSFDKPNKVAPILPGTYNLVVSADGYLPYTETLAVTLDTYADIQAGLLPPTPLYAAPQRTGRVTKVAPGVTTMIKDRYDR